MLAYKRKLKEIYDNAAYKKAMEELPKYGIEKFELDLNNLKKMEDLDKYGKPMKDKMFAFVKPNASKSVLTSIEKLCCDDVGKQAVRNHFNSIVARVENSDKEDFELEIKDNTLHVTFKLRFYEKSYDISSYFFHAILAQRLRVKVEDFPEDTLEFVKLFLQARSNKTFLETKAEIEGFGFEVIMDWDKIFNTDPSLRSVHESMLPIKFYMVKTATKGCLKGVLASIKRAMDDPVFAHSLKQTVNKIFVTLSEKAPVQGTSEIEVSIEGETLIVHNFYHFTKYPSSGESWTPFYEDKIKAALNAVSKQQGSVDLEFQSQFNAVLKTKSYKEMLDTLSKYGISSFEFDLEVVKTMDKEDKYGQSIKHKMMEYLKSGACRSVALSIERLAKDELGREAIEESFNKIILRLEYIERGKEAVVSVDDETLFVTLKFPYREHPSFGYYFDDKIEAIL